MLVFAREVDERVVIGNDIEVCIVSFETSSRVKIGFDAPKAIQIFRKEIITEREHKTFASVAGRQVFFQDLLRTAIDLANSKVVDLQPRLAAMTALLANAGYLE